MGGRPFTETLKARTATRLQLDRQLLPQILSDLLWAAFGVHRQNGDRTDPYERRHGHECLSADR